MDLGVLLESPQGSQSSSRVGACTCAFLQSCSSRVSLPFAWIKGSVAFPRGFPTRLSHEAFPRGFPTGLSHVPQWCESILGLKVEAVQGKEVSLEWTESSGGMEVELLPPRSYAVQFSSSVVSDSLRPHELQHARPPCPSPTPGIHSNSRPSSR